MKVAIAILNGIWDLLFAVPLFDTGVSFGAFLMAIVLLDVFLIIMKKVLRKSSQSGNTSPKNNSSPE